MLSIWISLEFYHLVRLYFDILKQNAFFLTEEGFFHMI